MRFAVSFFAAVSRLKLAVLTVGDLRKYRYRRALTAHPIDVYTDLFLYETLNGLRGKGSQTVFVI